MVSDNLEYCRAIFSAVSRPIIREIPTIIQRALPRLFRYDQKTRSAGNLHVARIDRMQGFAHVIECEGKMMCDACERAYAWYACVCAYCEHAREWVGLITGPGDSAALPAQPIITII